MYSNDRDEGGCKPPLAPTFLKQMRMYARGIMVINGLWGEEIMLLIFTKY